jgi:hypothetical protein
MTGWERLGTGGLSQGCLPGRLGPSAVLDDALAGIAAIDDDLSAFAAIDADGARRAAAELKRGAIRRPVPRDFEYVRIRRLVCPGNENAIQRA